MWSRKKQLIIVRGGGDIATGTIHRLHRCGYPVMVLETGYPSAIRRQVAFSEAVYDGTSQVENVSALGILETYDAASIIVAADIAAKTAIVQLIELRIAKGMCGKSYLLRNLFRNYLLSQGVSEERILSFELDLARDIRYRNPLELAAHVRKIVEHSSEQFYLFLWFRSGGGHGDYPEDQYGAHVCGYGAFAGNYAVNQL